MDPETASKLQSLESQKQQAVMIEDFELAKNLRDQIDALKRAGSELAELERQKAAAIQEENYDEAKRIKMMID